MNDAVEAVALAYVWGLPLVTMHRTRIRHGAEPALAKRERLSTARDRDVVAPNNDTLYASGWFDLGAGEVSVDVDPIDGRYWSVMLLDAYTHVRYVSRRTHGSAGASVRVRFDPNGSADRPPTESAPEVIGIGTRTLWVLARVVVESAADLSAARAALAGIRVRGSAAPPWTAASAAQPGRESSFAAALATAVTVDPPAPVHAPMPDAVADLLADPPPAAVIAEGLTEGKRRIAARRGGADRRANGWGTRLRGADFGDDILYRAAFTATSFGGHLPVESRSYSRIVDGSQPAVLRFEPGAEPPVRGFWSVTVYGPDLFFVRNAVDRYSIGDRTPGVVRSADGALAIELAPSPSGPPANWLPTPPGPCVVSLRAYEGAPDVVDATWFPPELTPLRGDPRHDH